MKNLIIFVSLLSLALGFPVGSPLHKRERRRRQLGLGYGYGYGYAPIYPYYNAFLQPNYFNDFTPEIYIQDNARPVTVRPTVTAPRRPTTSMVKQLQLNGFQPSGEPCPPPRGDDLNNDQLPVFVYVDPKEWSSMGAMDRPLSPGQPGSSDLQPAFAIVPGVFLPTSENGQAIQNPMDPMQNINRQKTPETLRIVASGKKEKDC